MKLVNIFDACSKWKRVKNRQLNIGNVVWPKAAKAKIKVKAKKENKTTTKVWLQISLIYKLSCSFSRSLLRSLSILCSLSVCAWVCVCKITEEEAAREIDIVWVSVWWEIHLNLKNKNKHILWPAKASGQLCCFWPAQQMQPQLLHHNNNNNNYTPAR